MSLPPGRVPGTSKSTDLHVTKETNPAHTALPDTGWRQTSCGRRQPATSRVRPWRRSSHRRCVGLVRRPHERIGRVDRGLGGRGPSGGSSEFVADWAGENLLAARRSSLWSGWPRSPGGSTGAHSWIGRGSVGVREAVDLRAVQA